MGDPHFCCHTPGQRCARPGLPSYRPDGTSVWVASLAGAEDCNRNAIGASTKAAKLGPWIRPIPLAQTALAQKHLSSHDGEHEYSLRGALVTVEDSTGRLNNLTVSPG
jgi:hypothetical protein